MAKRPALSIAMLGAVHARGEQGWKSGHLEPFSFGAGVLDGLASGARPRRLRRRRLRLLTRAAPIRAATLRERAPQKRGLKATCARQARPVNCPHRELSPLRRVRLKSSPRPPCATRRNSARTPRTTASRPSVRDRCGPTAYLRFAIPAAGRA